MKKLLLAIAAIIVIAAIGAGVWLFQSPDQVAKRAIAHYGGEAIGASIHVDSVRISPADGSGFITGFSVGSPEGFKAPTVLEADSIRVALVMSSLDRNAVALRTLSLVSPRITYERGQAVSNFAALLDNIARDAGKPGRKIIVDHIVIRNAKVRYASPTSAGQMFTVELPDIRLDGIGHNQGGVSTREFATAIVETLFYHVKRAIPASALQGEAAGPARK